MSKARQKDGREQGGNLIMLDAGCKERELALGQPEVGEEVDVPGL